MQPSNILLVDDNSHQHELFNCYAMFADGVNLSHANSIEETFGAISIDDFDVILLDNRLVPYNDFTETVPQIRAKGYKGRIVVISADIANISSEQVRNYEVHSCVDKFEFDAHNFEAKITQLAKVH